MSEFQKSAFVVRQTDTQIDDLPAGWRQALERSRKDLAEGRFVDAAASQEAARKDFEEFFSPPAAARKL
jgi:hypothetical protein